MDFSARPGSGEYADFYAGYVDAVPDGDIRETLAAASREMEAFYAAIPESKGGFAYAPGKWTIREVLAHVADSERVFTYRALRFGRGDRTPLPGFDQEILVPHSNVAVRPWSEILDDLFTIRRCTLNLFRSFQEVDYAKTFSDMAKAVWTIEDASRIPEILARAFVVAAEDEVRRRF